MHRVLSLRPMFVIFASSVLWYWRSYLEARMVLHMFAEFPILLVLGWLAWSDRPPRWLVSSNAQGFLGLTVIICVSAMWMIPAALDMALMSAWIAAIKMACWILTGTLARDSWRRMPTELQCFLLGNLAWMSITVGMLYQTEEQRLCVNYLVDDQKLTGQLLTAGGWLLVLWAGMILWANRPGTQKMVH